VAVGLQTAQAQPNFPPMMASTVQAPAPHSANPDQHHDATRLTPIMESPLVTAAPNASIRANPAAFMDIAQRRRRILEKQIESLPPVTQRQYLSDFDKLCANYLTGQPIDERKLIAFLRMTTGQEKIQPAELQEVFSGIQGADSTGQVSESAQSGSSSGVEPVQVTGSYSNALAASTEQSRREAKERQLSVSTDDGENGEVQSTKEIEEGEIDG